MFRFNLDHAVAALRRALDQRSAFTTDDLDELESHLRDHVESLMKQGATSREAFEQATARLGALDDVEQAFRRVRFGRTKRAIMLSSMARRSAAMIRNHAKVALRSLRRDSGPTLINLSGLAFGFACAILILLFVRDELSYDRFHANADRIYRVTFEESGNGMSIHRAVTHSALGPTLKREIPEVLEQARFAHLDDVTLTVEARQALPSDFAFADSTFLDVFSFEVVEASRQLAGPNALMLTRSMASKLFGDADPIGRHVTANRPRYGDFELEVVGIIEDVPRNSHLSFDALASRQVFEAVNPYISDDNWFNIGGHTYILTDRPERIAAKIPAITDARLAEYTAVRKMDLAFHLQALTDIHLTSNLENELQPNGSMAAVRLFGVVGFLILFMACANFVNLATARSVRRGREVGIRKVLGGARGHLGIQFLIENVALVFTAGLAGWILSVAGLGILNHLGGKELSLAVLFEPGLIGLLMGSILATGVLAGAYPAFVLARFRPALVIKGLDRRGSPGQAFVRNALIVTQIAVTCCLFAGTAVVVRQLDYVRSKHLGFDVERLLVLPHHRVMQESLDLQTVRTELLRHPGIEGVAATSRVPFQPKMITNGALIPEGSTAEVPVMWDAVDPGYVPTMGIRLVAGRNLMEADSASVLVNETAVRQFGWEDPIGKRVMSPLTGEPIATVVGVVGDLHYGSLHRPISAGAYWLGSGRSLRQYLVRVRPDTETIDFLKRKWAAFAPGNPFEYAFLDDNYDALYRSEARLSKLTGLFAGVAALIAALGLFGLAAYVTEERRKEIGIRKVVGATTTGVVTLLSKDFLKLVVAGVVIASPVAYLSALRWLEGFAYHASIGAGPFVVALASSLAVASVAVGFRTFRAASINPIHHLRHE